MFLLSSLALNKKSWSEVNASKHLRLIPDTVSWSLRSLSGTDLRCHSSAPGIDQIDSIMAVVFPSLDVSWFHRERNLFPGCNRCSLDRSWVRSSSLNNC